MRDKVISIDDFPDAMQGGGDNRDRVKSSKAAKTLFSLIGDHMNVADKLDSDELEKIGFTVTKEYDLDRNSRKEREEKMERAMEMALQVAEVKNYPFPKASNVIFPLMTSASIQFAARAYPAIFDSEQIVKGKIIGEDRGVEQPVIDPQTGQPVVDPQTGQPAVEAVGNGDKRTRADNIARHMSYQLKEEMTEWEEDTDKMLHMLPILGTVFRKTYFDSMKGRNVSELIFPKYLVVNNFARDIENAPRITHEFELYPDEIIERVRSDMFLDVELGSPSEYLDPSEVQKRSGQQMFESDDDAPHVFLEQHRSLDPDDDGYGEPYVVTVHKETSRVVRIVPRFQEEDVLVNKRGEIAKINATNYFTKYSFIPSPDGSFYDIGYGDLLYNINDSINSIINQLLDAGHLANTGGGFIGKGLRVKGGNIRLRPGEWRLSDTTGGVLKDSIVPIPHAQPSPVLFSLLQMLIEAGKEVASMKDIMSGEPTGNQTAAATMALIEQGMTSFKSVYKRFHRSLKQEFKKLFKLNSIYLSQEQYFNIMDDQYAISVEDYNADDVDVVPVSDISAITNMQKITKAQFLQDFINDPGVDGQEVRKRVFEAWNIEKVDELVAKTPPPPDPMIEFGKASMENEKIKLELDAAKLRIQELDSEAKRLESRAKALETLAKAESLEAGTQMQEYKQELEELKFNLELGKELDERSDDSRRVGGVETPPNNQESI